MPTPPMQKKKNAHQLKWTRASGAVNQRLTAPEQAQRAANFTKKRAKDADSMQKTARRTLIFKISRVNFPDFHETRPDEEHPHLLSLTTIRWAAAKHTQMSSLTFKLYIFCRSQVNLNPALWDLHKLRAWGVAAVSLVLCILV